jgi:hypothetical protein
LGEADGLLPTTGGVGAANTGRYFVRSSPFTTAVVLRVVSAGVVARVVGAAGAVAAQAASNGKLNSSTALRMGRFIFLHNNQTIRRAQTVGAGRQQGQRLRPRADATTGLNAHRGG